MIGVLIEAVVLTPLMPGFNAECFGFAVFARIGECTDFVNTLG